MNDLVLIIGVRIELDGGLTRCDVLDINGRLNRTPMSALDYAHPIDAFAEMLAKHGPKLGL